MLGRDVVERRHERDGVGPIVLDGQILTDTVEIAACMLGIESNRLLAKSWLTLDPDRVGASPTHPPYEPAAAASDVDHHPAPILDELQEFPGMVDG